MTLAATLGTAGRCLAAGCPAVRRRRDRCIERSPAWRGFTSPIINREAGGINAVRPRIRRPRIGPSDAGSCVAGERLQPRPRQSAAGSPQPCRGGRHRRISAGPAAACLTGVETGRPRAGARGPRPPINAHIERGVQQVPGRRLIASLLALTAAAAPAAAPAHAQDWPTRPVTMVVPFAAGGPADTVGRILAPRLAELLGQQIVIENVGGAGGMTGA